MGSAMFTDPASPTLCSFESSSQEYIVNDFAVYATKPAIVGVEPFPVVCVTLFLHSQHSSFVCERCLCQQSHGYPIQLQQTRRLSGSVSWSSVLFCLISLFSDATCGHVWLRRICAVGQCVKRVRSFSTEKQTGMPSIGSTRADGERPRFQGQAGCRERCKKVPQGR